MTEFGTILKNTLDEKGISQKWLADNASTTEATISRYVNSVNKPSILEILCKISSALNVSSDYLLGLSNVETPKYDVNSEERLVLNCIRKASDDDIDVIMTILKKYMSKNERVFLQNLQEKGETKTG